MDDSDQKQLLFISFITFIIIIIIAIYIINPAEPQPQLQSTVEIPSIIKHQPQLQPEPKSEPEPTISNEQIVSLGIKNINDLLIILNKEKSTILYDLNPLIIQKNNLLYEIEKQQSILNRISNTNFKHPIEKRRAEAFTTQTINNLNNSLNSLNLKIKATTADFIRKIKNLNSYKQISIILKELNHKLPQTFVNNVNQQLSILNP